MTEEEEPTQNDEKPPSQATVLAGLARQRFRFSRTEEGRIFAVPHDGPNVAHFANGTPPLTDTLAGIFYKEFGRVPSSQARTDALAALRGDAWELDPEPVALRMARPERDLLLVDLGIAEGHVVEIRPGRWEVRERSPIVFRRTNLTLPLPYPSESSGDVELLRTTMNVTDADWRMIVAWLVAAVFEDVPHPVLAFDGEQGSGKTTAARNLTRVLDPSKAPTRSSPRSEEDWGVAASGSWVVTIDNLSGMPAWLSDALCKTVTGDGIVRRMLFTDDGISVLNYRRPVILNGIDLGAMRGDLADRLLRVALARIDPSQRRTEEELETHFTDTHPRVLGGIFDLVAEVLRVLPTVTLEERPRLADFGEICAALDVITGWQTLPTFMGQAESLVFDVLDSDPVASAIVALVDDVGDWHGTADELRRKLQPEKPTKDFPTTAQAMAARLKRAAPTLRRVGIDWDKGTGRDLRTHYLTRREKTPERSSPSSPSSPTPERRDEDGNDPRDDGDDLLADSLPEDPWNSGIGDERDDGDDDLTPFSEGDDDFLF